MAKVDRYTALVKQLALTLEAEAYGALPKFRRELSDDDRALLDEILAAEGTLSWGDFLTELGICSEDAVGNRPCDNGAACGKCLAGWLSTEYRRRTGKESGFM